jgi:small subunit ribosomal protein S16
MAVTIRLSRVGRKGDAQYRVVVADQRRKRDGRIIEAVGWYHPRNDAKDATLNRERISYWISKGARPTATVSQLVKRVAKG